MKLSLKKLTQYNFFLLYFSQFILTTIPAQTAFIILFFKKPALPKRVYLYLFVIICYWTTVFSLGFSAIQLRHLLFYFSFIPPLLILLSLRPATNFIFITNNFFTIFFILTAIEALLFNTPFSHHLYFFPDETSSARVQFMGFYQRPMGIAGNPSMTSCVLIFSAVLGDIANKIFPQASSQDNTKGNKAVNSFFTLKTLTIFASTLLLASGTGFILLFTYFCTKWLAQIKLNKKSILQLIGLSGVILLMIYGSIYISKNQNNFDKFTIEYAEKLFFYKIYSVVEDLKSQNKNIFFALFGRQVDPALQAAITSADFGLLAIYRAMGILGSILVLSAPLLFIFSLWRFSIPTFFFYLSFGHYAGLLSPPGAVLFAIYLYLMFCYEQILKKKTLLPPSKNLTLLI
jgi:hypothetical protein